MGILKTIRKYKIKAKKLYTVIFISIIEIIMILWWNSWAFTPAIFAPLIQLAMIFENRDVWKKLSKKEKEEITLTEEEFDDFVKGVVISIVDGLSTSEILKKIKSETDSEDENAL